MIDLAAIPFNKELGLECVKVNDEQVIRMTPAPQHMNHVGSAHAGVVYSLAEAASALCLLTRFAQLANDYDVLLRSASVKYKAPATASFEGKGTIAPDKREAFSQRLASRGFGLVPVEVTVEQDGEMLLVGTFNWFAKARDAASDPRD